MHGIFLFGTDSRHCNYIGNGNYEGIVSRLKFADFH